MKEKLIDLETAKLSAEKGFNIRCKDAYCDFDEYIAYDYHHGDEELIPKRYNVLVSSDYDGRGKTIKYYAPTLSLLQQWLREKHNILVYVHTAYTQNIVDENLIYSFKPSITIIEYVGENIFKTDLKYEMFHGLKAMTYEDAMELGLMEALKLIK